MKYQPHTTKRAPKVLTPSGLHDRLPGGRCRMVFATVVSVFARLTLTLKLTTRKQHLFQWLPQFYTRPTAMQTAICP